MEVQFREMSEEEFKIFYENSINDYVNDLMKSSDITMEEVFAEAKREFAEMLPNGLGTKDNKINTKNKQ